MTKAMVSCRDIALRSAGYQGAFPDMWWEHLKGEVGSDEARMDLERQLLLSLGVTDGALPDMWYEWLGSIGYDYLDTLADRWQAYWCAIANGEPGAPGLPAAYLLNAPFDFYTGLQDHIFNNTATGLVLTTEYGVEVGSVMPEVAAAATHEITEDEYRINNSGILEVNWLETPFTVGFKQGRYLKVKLRSPNTPAATGILASFSSDGGSSSNRGSMRVNQATQQIATRINASDVDVAPPIPYTTDMPVEFMIVMAEPQTGLYFFRSHDYVTNNYTEWKLIAVQKDWTVRDDLVIIPAYSIWADAWLSHCDAGDGADYLIDEVMKQDLFAGSADAVLPPPWEKRGDYLYLSGNGEVKANAGSSSAFPHKFSHAWRGILDPLQDWECTVELQLSGFIQWNQGLYFDNGNNDQNYIRVGYHALTNGPCVTYNINGGGENNSFGTSIGASAGDWIRIIARYELALRQITLTLQPLTGAGTQQTMTYVLDANIPDPTDVGLALHESGPLLRQFNAYKYGLLTQPSIDRTNGLKGQGDILSASWGPSANGERLRHGDELGPDQGVYGIKLMARNNPPNKIVLDGSDCIMTDASGGDGGVRNAILGAWENLVEYKAGRFLYSKFTPDNTVPVHTTVTSWASKSGSTTDRCGLQIGSDGNLDHRVGAAWVDTDVPMAAAFGVVNEFLVIHGEGDTAYTYYRNATTQTTWLLVGTNNSFTNKNPFHPYVMYDLYNSCVLHEGAIGDGAEVFMGQSSPGDAVVDGLIGAANILKADFVKPNLGTTLGLVDLDELHDDYPTNGVGKIRKGSLVNNGNNSTIAGGVFAFNTYTGGQDLTEINPNSRQAGLAGEARLISLAIGNAQAQCGWYRQKDGGGANATQFHYDVRFTGGSGSFQPRWADGVSLQPNYLVNVGGLAAVFDKYVTVGLIIGGHDSNGVVDPEGTYGCLYTFNGRLVGSFPDWNDDNLHFGHYDQNQVSRIDFMRTKIDKGALQTPSRALFEGGPAVVSEQLAPQPISEPDNWVVEDVAYDEIPFGDAWTITNNVLTAHPAAGSANDKAAVKYPLVNGKAYRVIVNVATYRAGGTNVVFATVAGPSINSAGEHVADSNVLDYTPGFSEYPGLVRGTFDADVDKFEVYEISYDVDDYTPEDGPKFTSVRDNVAQVKDGELQSPPGESWSMSMIDIEQPFYVEAMAGTDGQAGISASHVIVFRFTDSSNYWRLYMQPTGAQTYRLDEIVDGDIFTMVDNSPSAVMPPAATPGTWRVKMSVSEDGIIDAHVVDSAGTHDNLSYQSNSQNDRKNVGLGGTAASGGTARRVYWDWFTIREGKVGPYTP